MRAYLLPAVTITHAGVPFSCVYNDRLPEMTLARLRRPYGEDDSYVSFDVALQVSVTYQSLLHVGNSMCPSEEN